MVYFDFLQYNMLYIRKAKEIEVILRSSYSLLVFIDSHPCRELSIRLQLRNKE